MVKLFGIQGEQRRQARRENVSQTQLESPRLWILSPSISTPILRGFGAKPDQSEEWPPGIYFLPKFFYTGLVAIHQLPVTPETLWLRVLGRGEVQKAAIDELVALPEANPLRRYLLEILASWRINCGIKSRFRSAARETGVDHELITGIFALARRNFS